MASITNSQELLAKILEQAGEPSVDISSYADDALEYMSTMQRLIVSGSNLFEKSVEESWTWAKSNDPIILTLQPAYSTGNVTFTNGDFNINFSVAPTQSLSGWFIQAYGDQTTYKIIDHNANSTSATLDADFIGSSATTSFKAFKLDYDLYPTKIYVTLKNNTLPFSEDGTTQLNASISTDVYTPTTYAAAVQSALNATGAASYTVTYDSLDRKFYIESDLSGGASVFEIWGSTGTGFSNSSALATLGFNDGNYTGESSYTSIYPHGAIIRLPDSLKIYNQPTGDSKIFFLEESVFSNNYPIGQTSEGMPRFFTKIAEDIDGRITIRLSSYPSTAQRVDVEWVPYPRDLQGNSNSRPIIPLKYLEVLEFGATYFIYNDKEDSKAELYYNLTQAMLQSMKVQNISQQTKAGTDFGRIIPRCDKMESGKRWSFGYTADE